MYNKERSGAKEFKKKIQVLFCMHDNAFVGASHSTWAIACHAVLSVEQVRLCFDMCFECYVKELINNSIIVNSINFRSQNIDTHDIS